MLCLSTPSSPWPSSPPTHQVHYAYTSALACCPMKQLPCQPCAIRAGTLSRTSSRNSNDTTANHEPPYLCLLSPSLVKHYAQVISGCCRCSTVMHGPAVVAHSHWLLLPCPSPFLTHQLPHFYHRRRLRAIVTQWCEVFVAVHSQPISHGPDSLRPKDLGRQCGDPYGPHPPPPPLLLPSTPELPHASGPAPGPTPETARSPPSAVWCPRLLPPSP
eukprot:GGOE01010283.1.p2 GENE.GGOE01010283.1~~GGOE01010283.1.p2  ORF type:complete len:216 (-),score=2.91 GGOE01010283.1:684-1331(-)